MKRVWMWPQVPINTTTVTDDPLILTEIEQYFSELYAPYKVVYFARARIGIMAISAIRELSRSQLTFVQPFSSHCVLSAVSAQSTPSTLSPQQSKQQIIYHQWGSKTLVDKKLYNNILIEDAVDSLILTNEKSELFPNNAPFCLISLPKICPVSVGALVVCQSVHDYEKLVTQRELMTQAVDTTTQYMDIACLQEPILQAKPRLTPKIAKNIEVLINNSANKIKLNRAVIRKSFPQLALNTDSDDRRLPANIAVSQEQVTKSNLYSLVPFDVVEQQRSYFNYNQQTCSKVWLLPCHCQANWY